MLYPFSIVSDIAPFISIQAGKKLLAITCSVREVCRICQVKGRFIAEQNVQQDFQWPNNSYAEPKRPTEKRNVH